MAAEERPPKGGPSWAARKSKSSSKRARERQREGPLGGEERKKERNSFRPSEPASKHSLSLSLARPPPLLISSH